MPKFKRLTALANRTLAVVAFWPGRIDDLIADNMADDEKG